MDVTTTVDIDPMDVLPEISTKDLVQEISSRPGAIGFDADQAITHLGVIGVPSELTDPIVEFLRTPIVGEASVRAWTDLCTT